jgi:hypothetical protein
MIPLIPANPFSSLQNPCLLLPTPKQRAEPDKSKHLIRFRLDTILETTLRATQQFEVISRASPLKPPAHFDEVHWSALNPIGLPITYKGRQRRLYGVLDYLLLWWAREHSETNLVVVAGPSRGTASLAREEAPVAMCEVLEHISCLGIVGVFPLSLNLPCFSLPPSSVQARIYP